MEVFPTMVLLTWWGPRLLCWLVRAGVGVVLWVASRNAALVFHSPHIIILDIELLLLYVSKKHAFWFNSVCHTYSFISHILFFLIAITVQLLVNVVILLIQ